MTRPSSGADRLLGLDLARYVAFVGMVIVNFKIAMGAEGGAGLAAAVTSAIEGRAAATFVVLAGIGLGLAGQAGLAQTGAVTLRRAMFLLALGLVNMTIFEADILHYYAVYFVFGVALLRLSSAGLIAVMAGLNGLALVMILSLDFDQGWDWQSYHYADFWTAAGFLRNLVFNGWHPVVPWLGFLVFGVLLSRQALAERAVQLWLVLGGVLAVALAEAGSRMLAPVLASIDPELAVLAGTDPVPATVFYFVAGCGAAAAVVGACLLLAGPLARVGLVSLLVPAGRQTLTLYIAHIVLGMGALEALGLLGGRSVQEALMAALVFCAVATVYAVLWARLFKRGPIEAAMRRIAG
ncbi:DUF418 domain-containing protein [Phaeobacter italicus]|uniref:DUF418 domain-containing protein n=1 Tax=Phaeobacter italicus TaxID=481446 RepID=UPI001ADA95C8|nr:DUF418 domain-containing protein [Phaeobacter italicus]MBO9441425.1 DUF418 domain-containing protein [Phaeobacter italicus]